jgi:hypothetical protein
MSVDNYYTQLNSAMILVCCCQYFIKFSSSKPIFIASLRQGILLDKSIEVWVDCEAISPTAKIIGTPDPGAQKTARNTVTARTLEWSCDETNVGATGHNFTNKARFKFWDCCVITIEIYYYYYYCLFIITFISYSILRSGSGYGQKSHHNI